MPAQSKMCAFCGKEGPHPEAHIWPRSLNRVEKGTALKVYKINGEVPPKTSQTGVYDSDLWCLSCEEASSALENQVTPFLLEIDKHKKHVLKSAGNPLLGTGPIEVSTIEKVDPAAMQRFVLSVLWRCSASNRPEVAKFTLGPYQERIREALQSKDNELLRPFDYFIRLESEPRLRGSFFTPANTKFSGVRYTRFSGGGFTFDVKMSSRPAPSDIRTGHSGTDGPVLLIGHTLLETADGRKMVPKLRAQMGASDFSQFLAAHRSKRLTGA